MGGGGEAKKRGRGIPKANFYGQFISNLPDLNTLSQISLEKFVL